MRKHGKNFLIHKIVIVMDEKSHEIEAFS